MTSTLALAHQPDVIAGYIDAAAALIERDGLHCGDFYPQLDAPRVPGSGRPPWTRGSSCCVLAALVVAQYPGLDETPLMYIGHFVGDPVVEAFAAYLGLRDVTEIGAWSDERTADVVVAELRQCAQNLRRAA